MQSLMHTHFQFPQQSGFYKGKVRDVYIIQDKFLVAIASDRISAFDVVLPRGIPYKGQVLNLIAARFLEMTKDIVPNWLLDIPHPNVSIGLKCQPFKIEMVVRNYMVGHLARWYKAGNREICGIKLPEGIKEFDQLPHPIITPSTKAEQGHDVDIAPKEIIAQQLATKEQYEQLEQYSLMLFRKGQEYAATRNLILADTKYEFGVYEGKVYLIDEVHTPDSSRYFYADTYEEALRKGEQPKQLSKEFVRQWLIENNFMGKEGQQIPEMSDEKVKEISDRYIELYENVMGEKFVREEYDHIEEKIKETVINSMEKLSVKTV
ncbi:MAG: phosphoribosylaminoimidazolesuccinocarboxamide synthase [Bacteroidetes bacterium]|nr:MAG: phosphoribosylaminoimidazolesuccinocarboxamide synthase [Bacteroidota bacterium]